MLDPQTRGALLEALRPPPGYVVDSAVATTYSLDLIALLTAPLAFSLYDRLAARENDGPERIDSFALLHAVRQHAEKLVVFCEAGCVAKPKGYRQLLTYLEDSLVQVRSPRDHGVFHPKVWVVRLTNDAGALRYRVLCLSRNLTFDRSWDTMLALDGELVERTQSIGDSKPLGDFLEALPGLALAGLPPGQRAIVERMADEVRRVRFEVPAPFETLRFWPLGHAERTPNPFADARIERLLVVSPFLAAPRLRSLTEQGKKHILVSRIDQLQMMPQDVLAAFSEVHVLHDGAEDLDGGQNEEAPGRFESGPVPPARGLHAKLYVADDGWNAHVWTGSANASDAAFGTNVELLVELTGKKSKVGVERFLDGDNGGLRALLVPFTPPAEPVVENEIDTRLDEIIQLSNRVIARAPWRAQVVREENQAGNRETFTVTLRLRKGRLELPPGTTVSVWPISLPDDRAAPVDGTAEARFDACSLQALTAFFAFNVTATVGARVERSTFVVRVPLEGAPEDRSARVLRSLLDDPAKVMRFLQMLLSLDPLDALELLDPSVAEPGDTSSSVSSAATIVPLFESLVRTLEREPDRLIEVDRLVRELRANGDDNMLLPPDFDCVWAPIWAAYESLRGKRSA